MLYFNAKSCTFVDTLKKNLQTEFFCTAFKGIWFVKTGALHLRPPVLRHGMVVLLYVSIQAKAFLYL